MNVDGKAVVATGHPLVSQAAIEMLENGGNAYDAAIAAGFVSVLAEAPLTSLGGGGFLLAHTRAGGSIVFDFFTDTPGKGLADSDLTPHFFPITVRFSGSDQDFNIGLGSVAVPGNLKGFLHVHKRLGTLPLQDILAPAIKAARKGVVILPQQAYFLKLLTPIMTFSKAGKKIYAPGGKYLSQGDIMVNPELAAFLEQLADDEGQSFYGGRIAERIAADMECPELTRDLDCEYGLLTYNDLCSYEVVERVPLKATYRDLEFLTNPPPSFGGSLIAAALNLLEQLPLSQLCWGSPAHLVALVETQFGVERHRANSSTPYAGEGTTWQTQTINKLKTFSRGTTHISIVDTEGNVASMTTSNGEGSGYIVPGTGIMLNNMMGEDDLHPDGFHASPAGQRVCSMMSPSLLLCDNKPLLVIGSGGSKRIRTAITQVISHIVDFGLDLEKAVNAPRLHWDGKVIQLEPGLNSDSIKALERLGPVNIWPERNVYFGGVQAVIPHNAGAGDPRRGGDARSFQKSES